MCDPSVLQNPTELVEGLDERSAKTLKELQRLTKGVRVDVVMEGILKQPSRLISERETVGEEGGRTDLARARLARYEIKPQTRETRGRERIGLRKTSLTWDLGHSEGGLRREYNTHQSWGGTEGREGVEGWHITEST